MLLDKVPALEQELQTCTDEVRRVRILNELAYRLRGLDPQRSIQLSEQAHELALASGDERGLADSALGRGFGQMIRGNYSECLEVSRDALRRFEALGDEVGTGRAGIYLGLIYRSVGNLDQAFEYYLDAYKALSEATGVDENEEEMRVDGLAWCLYGMAGVQEALHDHDRALDYYRQCFAVFEEMGLAAGKARALTGIGNVFKIQGEYEKALEQFHQSLEIDKDSETFSGLARTLTEIGDCLEAQGDSDQALDYNNRALELREQAGFRDAALTNRINLGRILLHRGVLDEALDMLTRARDEAQELKVKPKLYVTYQLLSQIQEQQGDFQGALENFQAFHRLEREVYSDESSSRIKNLQVANQVEASEREAEIQRLRNVELARLNEQLQHRNEEIRQEKEHSDRLLHNILPAKIVEELRLSGKTQPETFDHVTVFFSDFVGFTKRSADLDPARLIQELNEIFTYFDEITESRGCERIKTIGDAYLAVCGMPQPDEKHAHNVVELAREAVAYLESRNRRSDIEWPIRIGIHSGSVVGGVVGVKKYIYDVFGDTINTASRMESHSAPMRINVSESTYQLVKDEFRFEPRERVEVKGKGEVSMYFLQPEAN